MALAAESSIVHLLLMTGSITAANIVLIAAVVDSCYAAMKSETNYVLKDYNRWYIYVLLVIMVTAGNSLWNAFYIREKYSEAFRVTAWTMYPAIHEGDRIIANKMAYNKNDPKRGDVVVFHNPDNRQINYIKRVVAIAGDTVEMKNSELFVNGKKLEVREVAGAGTKPSQLMGRTFYETNGDATYKIFIGKQENVKNETPKDFGPITIPKYEVFVLGDNRNCSYDSRFFGSIPIVGIKGKATYLYWPAKDWKGFGKIE